MPLALRPAPPAPSPSRHLPPVAPVTPPAHPGTPSPGRKVADALRYSTDSRAVQALPESPSREAVGKQIGCRSPQDIQTAALPSPVTKYWATKPEVSPPPSRTRQVREVFESPLMLGGRRASGTPGGIGARRRCFEDHVDPDTAVQTAKKAICASSAMPFSNPAMAEEPIFSLEAAPRVDGGVAGGLEALQDAFDIAEANLCRTSRNGEISARCDQPPLSDAQNGATSSSGRIPPVPARKEAATTGMKTSKSREPLREDSDDEDGLGVSIHAQLAHYLKISSNPELELQVCPPPRILRGALEEGEEENYISNLLGRAIRCRS